MQCFPLVLGTKFKALCLLDKHYILHPSLPFKVCVCVCVYRCFRHSCSLNYWRGSHGRTVPLSWCSDEAGLSTWLLAPDSSCVPSIWLQFLNKNVGKEDLMVFWKILTHFNRVHHKHSLLTLNPYMLICMRKSTSLYRLQTPPIRGFTGHNR